MSRKKRKPEAPLKRADPKPEAADPKPETRDSKPKNANPKPNVAGLTDRRDFLTQAGQAAVALCGLTAAAGAVRMVLPDFGDTADRLFPLGRASDFKMNSFTWLRDEDLFVLRNEVGIGAFSSTCTHLGCTVRRTEKGFVCPCHGAKYDPFGRVTKGPATKPLPWYRVRLKPDGLLWVSLDAPLDAPLPSPLVLPDKGRR